MESDNDVELAIGAIKKGMSEDEGELFRNIPKSYTIENRFDIGWGLVIRSESSGDFGEVGKKIEDFLIPLFPLTKIIRKCILRVAFFSTTFTTTRRFSVACLDAITEFKAILEVSVYPTNDAEPEIRRSDDLSLTTGDVMELHKEWESLGRPEV